MKKVVELLCAGMILFSGATLVTFDSDEVQCCITPCSCLPADKRKPSCFTTTKAECLRKKGVVVTDCIRCLGAD
jgi:hypothetical protein